MEQDTVETNTCTLSQASMDEKNPWTVIVCARLRIPHAYLLKQAAGTPNSAR